MSTLIDQMHKIGNMENTLSKNMTKNINNVLAGCSEWQDLYYDGKFDYYEDDNVSLGMRVNEELEWSDLMWDKKMGFIAEERELMWYKKEEWIRTGKKFLI